MKEVFKKINFTEIIIFLLLFLGVFGPMIYGMIKINRNEQPQLKHLKDYQYVLVTVEDRWRAWDGDGYYYQVYEYGQEHVGNGYIIYSTEFIKKDEQAIVAFYGDQRPEYILLLLNN
jgi:hypothetical protein